MRPEKEELWRNSIKVWALILFLQDVSSVQLQRTAEKKLMFLIIQEWKYTTTRSYLNGYMEVGWEWKINFCCKSQPFF